MTKVTFVSAALIAAAVFTNQAMAARGSDAAARRATTKSHTPRLGAAFGGTGLLFWLAIQRIDPCA